MLKKLILNKKYLFKMFSADNKIIPVRFLANFFMILLHVAIHRGTVLFTNIIADSNLLIWSMSLILTFFLIIYSYIELFHCQRTTRG